jgi:NAD(P)-dependent dehydrogenase (short-subunit alcohol dehydrogenase family)
MEKKKTILITGATAGIGRHAALHLARAGHRVFATGRKQELLAGLQAEADAAGLPLETLVLDVTSDASIGAARAEVDRRTAGYGLDALINNAGYGLAGPVELLSPESVRAQFDTNVHGLLAVTRAFLPAMRRRRSGRVLNVSSIGGRMTFPFMGAYNATKYAVESLSDAMRVELRPFNVQVVLIEPGMIKSEFSARAQESLAPAAQAAGEYQGFIDVALQRFRRSEELLSTGPDPVARAMERAITSRRPRARYVAPAFAGLSLLLIALLPTGWVDSFFGRALGLRSVPLLAPAEG